MVANSNLSRRAYARNGYFRSPMETQQTISFLLAELARMQVLVDELNARTFELETMAEAAFNSPADMEAK